MHTTSSSTAVVEGAVAAAEVVPAVILTLILQPRGLAERNVLVQVERLRLPVLDSRSLHCLQTTRRFRARPRTSFASRARSAGRTTPRTAISKVPCPSPSYYEENLTSSLCKCLGSWDYPTFRLYVDHVQSDPYAPPSKLRVRVPHSVARIPQTLWSNKIR